MADVAASDEAARKLRRDKIDVRIGEPLGIEFYKVFNTPIALVRIAQKVCFFAHTRF